jgi:hypothetical protein
MLRERNGKSAAAGRNQPQLDELRIDRTPAFQHPAPFFDLHVLTT